jgi:heptosyltransferase-2
MRRCLVPPARVLVRMPSWLGDFVMAEPVVRALHERWSRASCVDRLTLVGPERFLALLDHLRTDGVRRIAVERGAVPDPSAWREHDVALLLDGSMRSAWAAFAAQIPERVGFASGGRTALLTQWIAPARERGGAPLGIGTPGAWPRRIPRPFTSACIELAAACGLEVTQRTPMLRVEENALSRVHARLAHAGDSTRGRMILVHAGARPDSAKGVPPATWVALLRSMGGSTDRIVVTCAPGEESNARVVRDLVPNVTVLDDPPLDLPELLAAHALADFVLTSDTGPRHLAQAAAKCPIVVLCGPTDPRHTSDHDERVRIARVDVPCGPCHQELCPQPGSSRHRCMKEIDPARVATSSSGAKGAPRTSEAMSSTRRLDHVHN